MNVASVTNAGKLGRVTKFPHDDKTVSQAEYIDLPLVRPLGMITTTVG
jgi:hypothetical protein